MLEIIQIPFMQKALIGGILLSVLLSVISLFINLKNWSFITVGISHATFGGLSIGLFLSISPPITGMIFAVGIGLLIGYISRKGDIHEDITIGILFSLSMAVGVIFLTFTPNYNTEMFTFLFGNILTITELEILTLAVFTLLSLIFIGYFFQKIMFCCYNEDVAYVSGINTKFYYYSIILIISIATVLSVKLVGVILTSAMMILPSALSRQIFWHYKNILVLSVIISIIMVVGGIFLSYSYNLPTGATIVFIYSLTFLFVLLIKKISGLKSV
ncbi:metal ABC transporter permease [Persephonella sp.]